MSGGGALKLENNKDCQGIAPSMGVQIPVTAKIKKNLRKSIC